MTNTAAASSGSSGTAIPELDDARQVLVYAREQRREALAAETRVLRTAVVWASQHPAESIIDAACLPGADVHLSIAGEGAPEITEFCIAEFAAALGMTTEAGRNFLGQAIELAHRLPRLYRRVVAGQVPAWRARRIAEITMRLNPEAAAFVDAHIAPVAHKVGIITAEKLVEEAIGRFMPDLAREQAQQRADGRHLDINHRQVSFDGTCDLDGELDLADALDLEAAIAAGAEALKAAGSTAPLAVRRAQAAGDLARAQLALALNDNKNDDTEASGDAAARPASRTTAPVKPRRVVIYAHLSADALTGCTCTGRTAEELQVARIENRRRVVTAEQVRTWCANPETDVVIKPVIDLDEHIHVGAYDVPDRLAEPVQLRDLTCVFPHCERPARRCDCDHVVEHGTKHGATCSCNIAPLCRRHHRLKTHSTWRYTALEPGTYLWSSPHGYQFLRDHTGTIDVTPTDRAPRRRFEHLHDADTDADPPPE